MAGQRRRGAEVRCQAERRSAARPLCALNQSFGELPCYVSSASSCCRHRDRATDGLRAARRDFLGQLQRLHRGDEARDQEQGRHRVADRAEGDGGAKRSPSIAAGMQAARMAAVAPAAASGALPKRPASAKVVNWVRSPSLGGEAEDEGGEDRQARRRRGGVAAHDQAGACREQQGERGQQGHRADWDLAGDVHARVSDGDAARQRGEERGRPALGRAFSSSPRAWRRRAGSCRPIRPGRRRRRR